MSTSSPQGRLFRKYVAVVLTLVGGVLILSSLTDLYFSYQETKRALVRIEHEKASAAAAEIERSVKDIERQVRAATLQVSVDDSAATSGRDLGRYREGLAEALVEQREIEYLRLLRAVPEITDVRHLDVSGKEQMLVSRFALDTTASGVDYSAAPVFTEARKGNKTYYGEVYFQNDSEPFMSVAIPSGEYAVEVTVAEVSLRSIWDVVSQIRVDSGGYAYVVDASGHLIAHPDVSLVMQKRDVTKLAQFRRARDHPTRTEDSDGAIVIVKGISDQDVLAAHAAIPLLGWLVFVERPAADALAPLREPVIRSAIIIALGLGLAVFASVLLARRMVAPIRALQDGAARIGAGDLDHRIHIDTGDELEALGDEFNRSAGRLKESYADLERKVEDRTRELADALERQTALGEALQRLVEEMRALGEVSRTVSSSLDVETVLQTIVTYAVQISQTDGGTIYAFDETAQVFEPRANFGVSAEVVEALRRSRLHVGDGSIVGQTAVTRVPIQVPDLAHSADYPLPFLSQAGYRALLALPLYREGRTLGALVLRRRTPGAFDERTLERLQTFAGQSTLALQNARLFAEITSKSEELEVASRHKSQFLANMSHELRTPLNAIIGMSEMLLEDARDVGDQEQIEPLERVVRAGKHLLALINDILDLSKIEAGRMELELGVFPLDPLVRDVARTVEGIARNNGNRIVVECPAELGSIHADQTRVRQVLLNLASNAAKFTSNGTVTIRASRETIDAADRVRIAVVDTGIGMTAEQVGRLFQEFVQADASTTRKFGGTGLGLAISRRFCRMMGGDIVVQSEPGNGSTFTMELPAEVPSSRPAPPRPEPLPAVPRSSSGGALVLAVDDDPAARDVMARFLAREGFQPITAASGVEALKLARELRPSAITLDVMMAGMDGWEVLAALKSDASLADIPVIMLTIVDDKARGYALGANDFMVKPLDREQMLRVLRRVCGVGTGRLLLIEDEPATRDAIRRVLERNGWNVDVAADGSEALGAMRRSLPDAIVLDLLMPGMDGFEFLSTLHADAQWQAVPVVVLTAKDLSAADHERLVGGVQRILRKEVSEPDDLLREVARLLGRTTAPVAEGLA